VNTALLVDALPEFGHSGSKPTLLSVAIIGNLLLRPISVVELNPIDASTRSILAGTNIRSVHRLHGSLMNGAYSSGSSILIGLEVWI
jgi:hypothetical protein